MDKPDLISEVSQAQQRMGEVLEKFSDAQLLLPAMDDWTGKDLIAHMAWWHDNSARVISALQAGIEPYDTNDPENATDALNRRTRREHADDRPDRTRQEFRESFNRLLAGGTRTSDGRRSVCR